MKLEIKKQKSVVRSQKLEGGKQRAENCLQKLIIGRQRSIFRSYFFKLTFIASLLVSIIWCTAGARAATLEGTVFDPSGRAVPRATVSLLNPLAAVGEKQADNNGHYKFEGLSAGAYRIVAHVPGFTTSTIDVQVRQDEVKTIDLRMSLSALAEHVIVSASLGGALAPQIGSSVSVITHQDINDRGAQSVLEVLRGVPGMDVNQSGRRGGATSVFIRGGNYDYALVMIDGIPVNQFGGAFDFSPLLTNGVDRIEVTRGPESALYGSNAVTGVVNIINTQGEGPPHFSVQAEGGSFDTQRFATGGSGLTHGIGWSYDVSRLLTQGVVTNDRYRTQSAFLDLGYTHSPRRQMSFHFFGNANDAGAPGPYGSDPDHLFAGIDTISRDKQNLFGYAGNYSEQFSARFRQVVTLSAATKDYYFRSPFGDSYSNDLRGVLNTRSELTVSSRDFLVFGFEYNREQTKNTFIADSNNTPFLLPRADTAYFAENRWNPVSRVFINDGVRVDNFRTHELPADTSAGRPVLPATSLSQASPRVSAAFMAREGSGRSWLGATRLHSSFGTGIREPSGFELAFTNNPNLKPEKSVSYDAGAEQRLFSNRAVLDATGFYNRFEDQIVVLGGSLTNLSTFTSANLGNSRARGLEFSVRAQPTRSLEMTGEYTFDATAILALENATLALSPFQAGQPLIRRPRNSGFYDVTWRHRKLTLDMNAYFRGSVLDTEPNLGTFACSLGLPCLFTNKGYTLANTGLAYQLPKGVEIYGRLNNFLNQKYEESLGYPALRLNFLAGIKIDFPAE